MITNNHLHPVFRGVFERHFERVNAECATLPTPPPAPASRGTFSKGFDESPAAVKRREAEESPDWEEDV